MAVFLLPLMTFIGLWLLEKRLPTVPQQEHTLWDHLLHAVGLFIQGCVIPFAGYLLSLFVAPLLFPSSAGVLKLGWWGSFLLNLIGVDFLYYWQHRAFHRYDTLWKLHACHHEAARIDVWTTARNSLLVNFLFVYLLINPFLAYFCDAPNAFYLGAMLTASLDIFRHSCVNWNKLIPAPLLQFLSYVFVMPRQHHFHHRVEAPSANFSANFILWDILFGTAVIHNPKEHEHA